MTRRVFSLFAILVFAIIFLGMVGDYSERKTPILRYGAPCAKDHSEIRAAHAWTCGQSGGAPIH